MNAEDVAEILRAQDRPWETIKDINEDLQHKAVESPLNPAAPGYARVASDHPPEPGPGDSPRRPAPPLLAYIVTRHVARVSRKSPRGACRNPRSDRVSYLATCHGYRWQSNGDQGEEPGPSSLTQTRPLSDSVG